jgi:hypothetical protein
VARPPDFGCPLELLYLYPQDTSLVSSLLLTRMVKRAHPNLGKLSDEEKWDECIFGAGENHRVLAQTSVARRYRVRHRQQFNPPLNKNPEDPKNIAVPLKLHKTEVSNIDQRHEQY